MTTGPDATSPAMTRRRVVVIAAVAVATVAVVLLAALRLGWTPAAAADPDGARSGIFVGHYVNRFEVSSFVPCGSTQPPGYAAGWWLESDPASGFREAYRRLVVPRPPRTGPAPSGPTPSVEGRPDPVVYVRFEGTVSDASDDGYGHLNGYRRYVTVRRVLEMSVDGGCPGAQGVPPS